MQKYGYQLNVEDFLGYFLYRRHAFQVSLKYRKYNKCSPAVSAGIIYNYTNMKQYHCIDLKKCQYHTDTTQVL